MPRPNGSKPPPLSPHLSVYAWHPGSMASIAHRMSGVFMMLCIPLYLWLISTMTGTQDDFHNAQVILHSIAGRMFLWLSGVLLSFHLLNGIRFLCLDAGWGERRAVMRRSAQIVFALSGAVALFLAVILW